MKILCNFFEGSNKCYIADVLPVLFTERYFILRLLERKNFWRDFGRVDQSNFNLDTLVREKVT